MSAVRAKLQPMATGAKGKVIKIWHEIWSQGRSSSKQISESKDETKSGLNRVRVRSNWWSWSIATSASSLAFVSIIAAISLGAERYIFEIYTKVIFGSEVPIDIQLAGVGVINKVLVRWCTCDTLDDSWLAVRQSGVERCTVS